MAERPLYTWRRVGKVEVEPAVWERIYGVFDPDGSPVDRFQGAGGEAAARARCAELNRA